MARVVCAALVASAVAAITPGEVLEGLRKASHDERIHAPVIDVSAITPGVRRAGLKSYSTILMHGLGDAGHNPGMHSLAVSVSAKWNTTAYAVDVADGLESFITPIQKQVDEFAESVKKLAQAGNITTDGIHVVGLSQGGVIVRAYAEQYAGTSPVYPPVVNLVSVCGVLNGVWDCPLEIKIIPGLCELYSKNPYDFLNGDIPLSFAGWFVTTDNKTKYLTENPWLPYLNNEVLSANSSFFKSNFLKINTLVMGRATEDTVVYPSESEQFGGYLWNTKTIFTFPGNNSDQWTGDLIGLRTLYNENKIVFSEFKGNHLRFNDSWWDDEVLPYLA